jgi:hypothetical protein
MSWFTKPKPKPQVHALYRAPDLPAVVEAPRTRDEAQNLMTDTCRRMHSLQAQLNELRRVPGESTHMPGGKSTVITRQYDVPSRDVREEAGRIRGTIGENISRMRGQLEEIKGGRSRTTTYQPAPEPAPARVPAQRRQPAPATARCPLTPAPKRELTMWERWRGPPTPVNKCPLITDAELAAADDWWSRNPVYQYNQRVMDDWAAKHGWDSKCPSHLLKRGR